MSPEFVAAGVVVVGVVAAGVGVGVGVGVGLVGVVAAGVGVGVVVPDAVGAVQVVVSDGMVPAVGVGEEEPKVETALVLPAVTGVESGVEEGVADGVVDPVGVGVGVVVGDGLCEAVD